MRISVIAVRSRTLLYAHSEKIRVASDVMASIFARTSGPGLLMP